MSLSNRYTEYLQDRRDPASIERLCAELKERSFPLEAQLLRHYADQGPVEVQINVEGSVWNGLSARVGPQLPQPQKAGDLWFDTCELTLMILLPSGPSLPAEEYTPEALARMSSFEAWMAIRPAAEWQYAAFLNLARLGPRQVQVDPPFKLLDPTRILQGNETQPASNLTQSEAEMYANWFGKSICGQDEWQLASNVLNPQQWEAVWKGLQREWGGTFEEGVTVVVSPETVNVDLMDVWDDEESETRKKVFRSEWSKSKSIGFRTRVLHQTGLFSSASAYSTSFDNVELRDVLRRDI